MSRCAISTACSWAVMIALGQVAAALTIFTVAAAAWLVTVIALLGRRRAVARDTSAKDAPA